MKPLDHSITYREFSFRNIPHITRLNHILRLARRLKIERKGLSYLDVGCSNGFITNAIGRELRPARITGLDHNHENLQIAKSAYHGIDFDFIDLNRQTTPNDKYSLITCFETLEHVGDIKIALQNIFSFADENATIVISVPIEIGFRGICKFFIKTVFFGYKLNELPGNISWLDYLSKLISGGRISTYRDMKGGWGNHFGFDYRDVDDIVDSMAQTSIKYNSFTTRFYIVALDSNFTGSRKTL